MHPSLQQTDFSFLFPSLSAESTLPSLKRAVKLVPSDAPAQWPTTTTEAAASARGKNRQSPGHARAREVERNLDRQGRLLDARITYN